MTRRADEHHDDDATTQFAPVDDTDAFLDALARGEDPSKGSDPLAELLLAMKDDVERPMPEAPSVDGVVPEPAELISLDERRTQRSGRQAAGRRQATGPKRSGMNRWAAGFIGAAAASALIAGSGAALYNATPGSPLWGASTVVFGDRAAAVELASTLKEIEVASQAGDTDYLEQLLQQANRLVESMKPVPVVGDDAAEDDAEATRTAEHPSTVTVSVTVTPEQEKPVQPEKPGQDPTVPAKPSAGQPAPSSQPVPQPSQPVQAPRPSQASQPAPSVAQSQPAQPQAPAPQSQANQQVPQVNPQNQQSTPKVESGTQQGEARPPEVVPQNPPQVGTQSSYGAHSSPVTPEVAPAQ